MIQQLQLFLFVLQDIQRESKYVEMVQMVMDVLKISIGKDMRKTTATMFASGL